MNDRVEIGINESEGGLSKQNPGLFKMIDRPPGVKFYVADWPTRSPGTVFFNNGEHSFTMRSVLSATGSDDPDFENENILEWNVNAGITDDDLINHDEARRKFFSILQSLRKAGWARNIYLSDPRLKGKDALNYMQSGQDVYGLDPDYVLSMDEWMSLTSRTNWNFYADHVYLEINVTRDPTRTDPNKPGAYFVEYTITSENEMMRAQVGPKKRLNWKAELPTILPELQSARKKEEERLKKNHVAIDETYQDPPLPDSLR